MFQMTLSKKEESSGKDIMLGDKLCKVIESPGKITFFDPEKKEGVSIKGEFSNSDAVSFIKELERRVEDNNNFEIKDLHSPLHWLLCEDKLLKNSFFNAQYLYGTKKDAVRNLNGQQEKSWVSTKHGPSPNNESVFARTIGSKKRFFKEENHDFAKDRCALSFYPDAQSLIDNKPILKREIRTGIGTGIVHYVAEHFDPNQDMRGDIINGLIDNAVKFYDKKREENEIKNPQNSTDQLAKKAGYVQGVCECVAAIVGNNDFGKKLLSEMNVTKDMAKKFASPETYKALEQGIFAPQHDQKQEQTRTFKR